jgi:hypothetical protein
MGYDQVMTAIWGEVAGVNHVYQALAQPKANPFPPKFQSYIQKNS